MKVRAVYKTVSSIASVAFAFPLPVICSRSSKHCHQNIAILLYCRILQSNDHVKEASCCRGDSNSWELKPICSILNLKQHLCALMIKPSSKKLGSALFQSQRKTGVGSKLSANVKSLRFSEKKAIHQLWVQNESRLVQEGSHDPAGSQKSAGEFSPKLHKLDIFRHKLDTFTP